MSSPLVFHIGVPGLVVFSLYQGLKLLHSFIRKKHLAQQTGMHDLPLLSVPREDGKKIDGTAVICGGSIAGLVAARICSDHFERVVIVEPEGWLSTEDAWTTKEQKRTRVVQWDSPQETQVWSILCLKKLFPNFERECEASNIPFLPADLKAHFSGMQIKSPFEDYKGAFPRNVRASRPSFELLLRRLVFGRKDYPNVSQTHGTVIGFEKDVSNPKYIRSVRIRRGSDNEIITIPATLVLDCTGPAKVGAKLIRRLGFGPATTEREKEYPLDELTMKYDPGSYYSSVSIPVTDDQLQRLPKEVQGQGFFGNFFPDASAGETRALSGIMSDRNLVQFIAAQWGGSVALTTLDDYELFARSLCHQKSIPEFFYRVFEVLKEAEEKAIFKNMRLPPGMYTPFHRIENLPSNWVALGDSAISVNPTFGQGVSKIFLDAAALNRLLHGVHLLEEDRVNKASNTCPDMQFQCGRLSEDFSKRFFATQAQKMDVIWEGVKGFDYNFDTTTPQVGDSLSNGRFLRHYGRTAMKLATKDKQAASAFWHIFQFLAPPIDYFHPSLVPKVLWEMIRERISAF